MENPNVEGSSSTSLVRRRKAGRRSKRALEGDDGGFGVGIDNVISETFPFRSVTKLKEGVHHIYTEGKKLTNRDRMRCHGAFTTMLKWWKKLNVYPQIRDPVLKIFGRFMDIELKNSDNRCIHAIVERWWPTTHTFLFPNAEIGFTPLDFTMLTSIPIGVNTLSIPYDENWSVFGNASQFLPLLVEKDIRVGNVALSHLVKYFADDYIAANLNNLDHIARIFVLYMMGVLFFTTTNDTISLGYLESVMDLELAQRYDWGSAILGYLYQSLDLAVTKGGHLTGFIELLQYWFFEYMTVCGYIVKENVKQSSYPRLKAWEKVNRLKTHDTSAHLFSSTRYHIDHRQAGHINWNPWNNSVASEVNEVVVARNLSMKRLPLLVPHGSFYELFLGERCLRQLSGVIAIPLDPPIQMTRKMTHNTYSEMQLQLYQDDCQQYIYQGQDIDYNTYWKSIGRDVGPLLDAAVRIGNMDFFGPSALKSGIQAPIIMSSEVNYSSQFYPPAQQADWAGDPGWYMQWTGRDPLPIPHLSDLPPVPSHYTVDSLWEMNMGMRHLALQGSQYYEEGLSRINTAANEFDMEITRDPMLGLASKSTGQSKSRKKRKPAQHMQSEDEDEEEDEDEDEDGDEDEDDDDDADDDEDSSDDDAVFTNKYGVKLRMPTASASTEGSDRGKDTDKGKKKKSGGLVSKMSSLFKGKGKGKASKSGRKKSPGLEDL